MAVALLEENPTMTSELYDQARRSLTFRVWGSREAWDRFLEERLRPAVEDVFIAAGLEPPPPHRQEIFDLHTLLVV